MGACEGAVGSGELSHRQLLWGRIEVDLDAEVLVGGEGRAVFGPSGHAQDV